MQVYGTSMMTSEMHSLISSGVETHNFQSRNMFLGNSEGEMSNRSPVMATSYQGLENNNPWKSMNVQESRSNTAWAAPNIVIPSNIQGIASYGVQNMANSLLFTGGVSSRSEASATASMMEIHPTNGLTFDTQKSFVEGSFNIPSLIQTVSSEVSPSVRDSTRSQWQSSGSGSGSGSDGNMQQHNQLVLSHLHNTLNWGNGRSGSQQWSSRDPFLQNISAGQDRSGQGLSLSLSFHHPSELHLQDLDNQANVLQMDGDIKAKPEDLFRGTTGANSIPYSISSSYPRDGMCAEKGIMNTLQGRPLMMHINGGSAQGAFASHASSLKNSVYLRAAQELLYEFCNVGVGNTKTNNSPKRKPSSMSGNFVPDKLPYGTRNSDFAAKSEGGMNREMYSGDRFELQRRKAKLVSMLEEVDRRYKHYRNQMQAIIKSFESVTTIGGAAPYTSLALKAMSRHFRCLRDVISSQLQMTSKSLGENDSVVPGTTRGETPRLGFLERSIRQQRALQQLGMMEQHPWRPQRGLPERSVSVLRAWLFEHFLHPYPTDADKHILARQTGLTRSQVSNWFINARVRLWKPMVEEMYLEEAKEEKVDSAAKVGAQDTQEKEKEKEKGERSAGTNSTDDQKSAFKSGGGSDSQCTASEEEAVAAAAFKLQDHSCTMVSQTAKAEIFDTMKLHNTVPSSQDDIKDLDMALIRESETLSAMNTSQGGMKFDQAPSYKKFEDHDKGLYINKLQATHDTDMTLDFSSYNMTTPNTMAAYSQEELTPRHFANSGVSLTLGLHHSGGLSFPMSEDKYDNNMYFPRDDPCSNQYTMLENDGSQANGFIEPDLQFRNYVSGGRLLHDFVG